jgi:hypothetical protein
MTRRLIGWMNWVSMANVAIASAGCATGPAFVAPEPSTSGSAVVYVYRAQSIFGAGVKPEIWIDARQVGAMVSGGYKRFEVMPGAIGATRVSSPDDCRPTSITVTPAAEAVAYVQVELTNRTFELGGRHYFDYGCRLAVRTEAEALAVLPGLRLATN